MEAEEIENRHGRIALRLWTGEVVYLHQGFTPVDGPRGPINAGDRLDLEIQEFKFVVRATRLPLTEKSHPSS
jgi:hypothetical protein